MRSAHWVHRALIAFLAAVTAVVSSARTGSPRRVLAFEPLEARLPLSAAGLVDVGTQPEGGLSGKVVYVHAGHGYTADTNGVWSFQRGPGFGMIEDLGNVDQMNFLVDYLFSAGATVVPLRPVGHQTNEYVIDNDDVEVTFFGNWSDSSQTVYFGDVGDIPYRYAATSVTETAYARYQPNIDEAGFYPVYAWTRSGSDRAADQLYRVHHSGGITEVTVNHRMVGNGLVYLGTYYFESGTNGFVDISNRSNDAGRVVIADMIRFGNGMGDIDRGAGVSGLPREDESGLYWVMWHVNHSQGIPTSEYRATSVDRDAAVSFSPRYAEYMNREVEGTLSDRVFVSYHSNASGGRGTLALYNGNNNISTKTPNQFQLANFLGAEVNDDLVTQNGLFEHNWFNRGSNVTLDRSDIEFGEINNLYINNEFDATIVEVAFHDNQQDAELMRDPKVRDAVARATYQGLVKYFRSVDGNTTSSVNLPAAPKDVYVESSTSGSVTVAWTPPAANSYLGDAPTGYRIYVSANGYGFDGGTYVAGAGASSATLSGYDPNLPYYFKIVAVNAGGESPASEVLAAVPTGGTKQVLVVSGFDRLDRSLNPKQPAYQGVVTDRVRPRWSNSFDYTVQVGSAIHTARPGVHVESASNEAVISGAVDLTDYHTVIWILGEESSANKTFDATEQALVTQFLQGGGNLFLSGAEIGWDLDNLNNGRTFYEQVLLANYVADDANTYNVNGIAGRIFEGLSFSFDNGSQFYDVDWPDVINPQAGAMAALTYANGAGNAAIQAAPMAGRGGIVMFGFPFETITTAANRTAVMERVLGFFAVVTPPPPNADFNDDGTVDAADFTVWRDSLGQNVVPGDAGDANHDGVVDQADFDVWRQQFGTSLGAGGGAGAGDQAEFDSAAWLPTFADALADGGGGAASVTAITGGLSGRIVYMSAGHGWQWSTTLNRWATDRGDNNEIVEDFGNQDQLTFFADYVLRAGGTVVPMRPVGRQLNEVVLDNDSPGVTFTGAWSNSNASIHYDEDYGAVADLVSYRFATISATETAAAIYRPTIPQSGFYPVYSWVADGSNRTNQLYRIVDSDGGVTEIRVDHRLVGKGWVYLGTYHFGAGTGGYVEISNQSTAGGSVVIADAIRFGNGIGDLAWGSGGIGTGAVSGRPREDEASLLWLYRSVGQGATASSVLGTSNVSAPLRMAARMNASAYGNSVYISFHSNAASGTARGAVGLVHSSNPTPNQTSLATFTARQIDTDMRALNGQFEYNWQTRPYTLAGSYGEITNVYATGEFDATIIEVGFHDNEQDAALMRDPKVRDQLARSTYEAVIEYFAVVGGLSNSTSLPARPTNIAAVSDASGNITVSWSAGPTGVQGGAPTGFRIYVSRNGYGFGDYLDVAGGGATSVVIPAAELDGDAYYFQVVAVNSGGASPGSAVAGARTSPTASSQKILIVDGFDRYDRTQNARYPYPHTADGLTDRVWARYNNSFDYVVQVGAAIAEYERSLGFDFVQNEAVIAGTVDLSNYHTVIWMLGEESTANRTFDSVEQQKVAEYHAAGGNLFVSGSEIAWDLDRPSGPSAADRAFYETTMLANYVADTAGTYSTVPHASGIFAGLGTIAFSNGASFSSLDSQFYDVNSPDVISPQPGAEVALNYSNGAGAAAIQALGTGGRGSLVMLAFPFEAITSAPNRAAVIDRVFDFFGLAAPSPNGDFNHDGAVDAADYTIWRDSLGKAVTPGEFGDANFDGQVDDADYSVWRDQFGTSSGSAAVVNAAALAQGATPFVPFEVPVAARIKSRKLPALNATRAEDMSYSPSLLITKKFARETAAEGTSAWHLKELDDATSVDRSLDRLSSGVASLE